MRVQAKVLNLKTEKYEHLHHKNKHGFQVDLLIRDAKKNRLIPLYCLYSNWEPSRYKAAWECQTHKPTVRHYGTSILAPSVVKNLQSKNENRLSSVIGSLKPMHCIFCCKGFGGRELPDRALSWLDGIGILDEQEYFRTNKQDEYLLSEPPYYIRQMLEGRLDTDFIDVHDERLKRVTVFKELISK